MSLPTIGQLLARGRTAEIYESSPGLVVKLFYEWVPQEWIQRELRAGASLQEAPFRTPRHIDQVIVNGRTGIVLERISGPSMLALLSARPWLLVEMAHQFADLHWTMHELTATGLPPLRPHLHSQIMSAESIPARIKDHALRALAGLPDGRSLCHFDFHPDQVIMTGSGPVILDWMTALQGDPLADVARTSTLIRFAQAPHTNRLVRALTDALRSSFHTQYLDRYLRRQPKESEAALEIWMLPVTAARLAEAVPGEREAILAFLNRRLAQHTAG